MQDPVRAGPFAGGDRRTKYKWDEDARAYRAGRVLPLAMVKEAKR